MIARVFPRRTAMTPRDGLAFFKEPTIENIADCIKENVTEVHISVTFTWDILRAEDLYYENASPAEREMLKKKWGTPAT